ncbi:hypothetical protein ACFVTF_29865 [Kitasatospora sp. NPDC057940]|uniref:hypothetical protein n=1 Tax=Kitasatospora sp. NPDC057940 TaxID=3346285 RepID=UPI0036D919B8
MVPEGYTYVKGHIRRKPRPRINKTSGWLVAALVVGGLWLYGQSGGSSTTTNTNPGTTAPASAPAAGH